MDWLEIIATVVSIISGIAAIVGGLVTWRRRSQKASFTKDDLHSITQRFIALFEAHGVHQNQIPCFFKHEITLADVHDAVIVITEEVGQINDRPVY